METIKDLQDKLSLVLWVNRNIGKLCEFIGLNSEDEEVLQMGRIVGYNVSDDKADVIVERLKYENGWNHLGNDDVILIPKFDSSTYGYKLLNEINIIV